MVFTRSPTHTWAQRTLVQCSCNMQSLSLGSKLLSVNPSGVENTSLQTEEVCVSFIRSLLPGRARGLFTAERKPDALPHRFTAAHKTEGCLLHAPPSSGISPGCHLPHSPFSLHRTFASPAACFYPRSATLPLNTYVFLAVLTWKRECKRWTKGDRRMLKCSG